MGVSSLRALEQGHPVQYIQQVVKALEIVVAQEPSQ
jgi:hypothetical protein